MASFLLEGASEALAAEANEDGSWWLAEESRLIKLPTARYPIFDCRRTIAFGRREKREPKSKKNKNASKQSVRIKPLFAATEDSNPHLTQTVSGQRTHTAH